MAAQPANSESETVLDYEHGGVIYSVRFKVTAGLIQHPISLAQDKTEGEAAKARYLQRWALVMTPTPNTTALEKVARSRLSLKASFKGRLPS